MYQVQGSEFKIRLHVAGLSTLAVKSERYLHIWHIYLYTQWQSQKSPILSRATCNFQVDFAFVLIVV